MANAEHYTFPNNAHGLAHAWECAVSLRRFGYRTRLATRQLTKVTTVRTVDELWPERNKLMGFEDGDVIDIIAAERRTP